MTTTQTPIPARISILKNGGYSDNNGTESAKYDRASAVAGAENALFSASSEAVHRSEAIPNKAKELSPVSEGAAQDNETIATEDLEDDMFIYKTDSYRTWECHYLRRVAKQIHRLACNELDRSEEALFMCFIYHDSDLDGLVSSEEAPALIEAVERYAPGVDTDELMARDGSISFLSLLKWYSQDGGQYQETTTTMNMTSLAVGMLGSGYVGCDSRIDALDWKALRANIVGYRNVYSKLREFKEERNLRKAREVEESKGLHEAMVEYYRLLAAEFEGDEEHLFELFNEVDVSGNMLLEHDEIEALLRMIDTSATPDDLKRYTTEINLEEGNPLSFSFLIDWWEQARCAENSLVATKGMSLLASVRARVMSRSLGAFMSTDSASNRKWSEAASKGRQYLEDLRDAYIRTFREVREFKKERAWCGAEAEAAKI